jgi:MFS family permease
MEGKDPAPTADPPLRRNREFMLLWGGQAISELGSRTAWIGYPLLVLAITGSPAKAGVAGFASRFPFVLFSLPAGALVDRWDRKRIMLGCDAGRALGAASIAVALALGRLTFAQILIVAAVEGTLSVFVEPAEFAAVRRLVPQRQIAAAIAHNEGRVYAASLGGPPLGGFLFALGRGLPFLADTISYLVSLATLLAIKTPFQGVRSAQRRRFHRDIGEGVLWLWRQAFLRTTFLVAGGGNFVSNGLVLVIIVLAKRQGVTPATIGLVFAFGALGGLAGAALAPILQRHLSAAHVRIAYHGGYVVLIPLLAVASPLLLGLLLALMLFGAPLLNAVFGAYEAALVPDHLQGRVGSIAGLVAAGAAPLGTLFAGFLLQTIGAVPTVYVFATLSTAVALTAILSRPLRRMPDLKTLVAAHSP